jgi:hypothetical protein
MSLSPDTVVLHPVKPILSLRVISLLPELLHVEVCRFSEVVFGRVPYFVVEERYIIVCVVVDLRQAVRVGTARNVRLIVVTAIEQAIGISIRRAIGLVIRGREIFIVS